MQDPSLSLSDDEVRDLFSAFHEGSTAPAQTDAVRAAFARNPELRREYESFARVLAGLGNLGLEAPDVMAKPGTAAPRDAERVDLLPDIQRKLHRRSGGKFYRDRWSRAVGVFPVELVALVVLAALVLAWLGMTSISVRPARSPQAPASQAPAAR